MKTLADILKAVRYEDRTCEKHGPYQASVRNLGGKERVDPCPGCLQLSQETERFDALAAADLERTRASDRNRLDRAGIPARFRNRDFTAYHVETDAQKRALRFCQAYADRFATSVRPKGAGLVLCGGVGTGKTHLAAAIANQVIAEGFTALFIGVAAAVRRVKDSWRKESDVTEQQAIDGFLSPDLLILDEVGVQFGSETEKLFLFEIINGRYEEMLPTVLISNLGKTELADYVGSRVMDRMQEGGGAVVAFDWESHRAKTVAGRVANDCA